MVLFQNHDTVLKDTCRLGRTNRNSFGLGRAIEDSIGAFEEMEQILQPGVGSEVNTIEIKLGSWEAWEKMEVSGQILPKDLGEQGQHFWQTFSEPNWGSPVHWRCKEVLSGRACGTGLVEQNANVLENWLDSLGDGRRPLDRGQEVRDAGHDDDVRLSADLPQGVAEDLEVTTRKNLGILDGGICTTVRLIDIVPDIGVTEQGVDSNLRHRKNVETWTDRQRGSSERR